MKKILLMGLGMVALVANVQLKNENSAFMFNQTKKVKSAKANNDGTNFRLTSAKKEAKKSRAVPFYTEDFGSGTSTSLPTGWTVMSISGNGNWKWRKTASASNFSIGVINSTTANNGWMIYDADSIATASSSAAVGYLTSPSINCSTHPTVMLRLQQHYRKFTDSCNVYVSNDNGVTWTIFDVLPNNNLGTNTDLPSNPHQYYLNISSVASNQANVKIRFAQGTTTQGAYSWLIDDVLLSELDPIDASISKSFLAYRGDGGFSSFATMPFQFADSVAYLTNLSNIGSNALPSVPLTCQTYNPALVDNQNLSYLNLPVGALDSVAQFDNFYKITTRGDYTTAFKCNVSSDAVTFNNSDTITYGISDSVFSQNVGSLGGYYVHNPANPNVNPPVTELSLYWGTLFEIPVGKSDTITRIIASFSPSTTNGSKVRAKIYKFNSGASSWDLVTTADEVTLNSTNISSNTALRFASFNIPYSSASVLETGTYAAVVDPSLVAFNQTVVIYVSERTTDLFTVGVQDDVDFGTGGLPSGVNGAPMVQMVFGKIKNYLGVNDIKSQVSVSVSPNPASEIVTFDMNFSNSFKATTITLTNTIGQVVKTVQLGNVSANSTKGYKMNVSDLSKGLYIYTITADGKSQSGKLSVN